MVNLTINGKAVSVKEGTTILEAARTIGETIPTLCYLKEINERFFVYSSRISDISCFISTSWTGF